MSEATRWRLYVDESGDFGSSSDTLAIAGILLREGDGPGLSEKVRDLTARFFPGLPAPLHAAHLNAPAFHLLHRAELPEHAVTRPFVDALARGLSPHALSALDAEAEEHAIPPLSALLDWQQRWLPPDASAARALRGAVHLTCRNLLSAVADAYGREGCVLLGAVDFGGAGRREGPDADERAYTALLTLLFERLLCLRRASPARDEELFVIAEARGLRREHGRWMPLASADIEGCIRAAELFPFLPPTRLPDPHLRVIATEPQTKADGQDPGLVLADLAVGLLRRHLAPTRSWSQLVAAAPRMLGLPVQLTALGLPEAGPLPAIGAAAAAEWLQDAFGRAGPRRMRPPPGGWGGDQARLWRDALVVTGVEVVA